jgi:hypothetical protein
LLCLSRASDQPPYHFRAGWNVGFVPPQLVELYDEINGDPHLQNCILRHAAFLEPTDSMSIHFRMSIFYVCNYNYASQDELRERQGTAKFDDVGLAA